MIVHIAQVMLQDNALSSKFAMESGINGGVERNIFIGHNAAATVNGATFFQRLKLQRVGKMDAVSIGKLTTLKTIDDIHSIIAIFALGIRLLDASARWSIVMCNSESDHRAVGHVERALNKTLTKGTATNHDATVLILDGAGNNFGRRGCITVDKHYYLTLTENTAAIGLIFSARHLAAHGIYNQVVTLQELVGDIYSGLEIASAILLEIENKVLHALIAQGFKTLKELLMGSSTKVTDTDITYLRTNHIDGINRLYGNLIAYNGKGEAVFNTLTDNAKLYFCALRTAQTLHNLLLGHLYTCDGRIVDRDDSIACNDAYLF